MGRHTFLRREQEDAGQRGANVGEKWARRVVWHLQRLSQPGVASLPQWEGDLASGHTGLGHGWHSLWHSQTNIFPCLNLSFLVFKSTCSQNDLLTPGQDALGRQMPACPCAGPSLGASVLIIGRPAADTNGPAWTAQGADKNADAPLYVADALSLRRNIAICDVPLDRAGGAKAILSVLQTRKRGERGREAALPERGSVLGAFCAWAPESAQQL